MTAEVDVVVDSHAAFSGMAAAFDCAVRECPDEVRVSYLMLAGRIARLQVVGTALDRHMRRAFAHLLLDEDPAVAPQLQIDLWDQAATGVGCASCHPQNAPERANQITTASADGRIVIYQIIETIAALDRGAHRLLVWVGSAARLTQYERGRPLLPALLLWLMDRQVHALHAGLVARNGRGILLGGPSGAGKSTVALSCVQAGFDYLADDCMTMEEIPEGGFLGHSLFGSANLKPDHLERMPRLSPHAIPGELPWEDKSLLLLSSVGPTRLARSVPIAGIVLPKVVDAQTTTLRRASRAETLLRMAPSCLFMFPHARGAPGVFDKLTRLIERVPGYWLELGTDLEQIASRVDEVLLESPP
jgi:hypothetical protein